MKWQEFEAEIAETIILGLSFLGCVILSPIIVLGLITKWAIRERKK